MKHHIEWLKEKINVHVEMSIYELFTITACLMALLVIAVILFTHI